MRDYLKEYGNTAVGIPLKKISLPQISLTRLFTPRILCIVNPPPSVTECSLAQQISCRSSKLLGVQECSGHITPGNQCSTTLYPSTFSSGSALLFVLCLFFCNNIFLIWIIFQGISGTLFFSKRNLPSSYPPSSYPFNNNYQSRDQSQLSLILKSPVQVCFPLCDCH